MLPSRAQKNLTSKKFAMEAWGIMDCRIRRVLLASVGAIAAVTMSGTVFAEDLSTPESSRELLELKLDLVTQQERLAEQERQLAEQARLLEEQRRAFERQQEQINALQAEAYARQYSQGTPQIIPAVGRGAVVGAAPVDDARKIQAQAQAETQQPVGEAPKEKKDKRPEVAALVEVGGVLTPKGSLVLEPSFSFSHSSVNRFVFQGIEIVDAVLIGLIEASDADRDTLTAAMTGRVGLTNRLEFETKVPYVYRKDRVTNLILSSGKSSKTELQGHDLGDIEFGAHYQINSGQGGLPYFVGNLRVKSDTGTSPFEVSRDANGIEQELATGSGFWGVQPSITAIFPSDPAVFYANVGYLWNIKRSIDRTIGGSLIGDVDPGDNVSFSFGMGFGINERASFNLGYEHNFILETKTEINGADSASDTLQVGSLVLGLSYRLSDMVGLNVNLSIGATTDAPDASLTFRVPVSISNLF
jgi:uncharacterized coiled-coil protein SlyX